MNNMICHETSSEQFDVCRFNKTDSIGPTQNYTINQRLSQEDLVQIAQCGEDAFPAIMTAFHDSRATIRATAAALSSSLQVEDDEALIDALCDALFDPDVSVREMSASSLSDMAPSPHHVINRLIESLEWEGNAWVLIHVLTALAKTGQNAVSSVPAIIKHLSSRSVAISSHAAHALGSIGKKAHLAIPPLKDALDHPHEIIRQNAQYALNQIE